ncbi:radical SAM protein [bacterium]|nr:radical SAM protein [bacterium]
MGLKQAWDRLNARTFRKRRHASALLRYGSLRKLVNIARVETERALGRDRLVGKPYMLIIDPLNVCNLKCPLCPTGRGELPIKNGKMELEAFKGLVDSIAPHTVKIMLYNWGEPFLHKDILGIIGHAHQRGIATALSSNLNLLPKEGAEGIVRSGLDDLIISCDGLTQDVYEKYRKGGNVEKVFKNLKDLTDTRRRLGSKTPYIEFQFLVFEHNEHQVPEVEARARELGADFVRVMPPYVGPNDADIRPARGADFRKPEESGDGKSVFEPGADLNEMARRNPPPLSCFWPWRSMVINWNGQVDPCCFKNYQRDFGNVFLQPVDQIWNSDVYRYARRWISGKATGEAPYEIVCRGCPGYH